MICSKSSVSKWHCPSSTWLCLATNASLTVCLDAAHLHITVGQKQVHDDIWGEQLHAVQSPLQASQLLSQPLPTEPLPSLPDVLPNGLPKIATDAQAKGGRRRGWWACPSVPCHCTLTSLLLELPSCGPPLPRVRRCGLQQTGKPAHQGSEQSLSARPGLY
jgi:hypothetical protein